MHKYASYLAVEISAKINDGLNIRKILNSGYLTTYSFFSSKEDSMLQSTSVLSKILT